MKRSVRILLKIVVLLLIRLNVCNLKDALLSLKMVLLNVLPLIVKIFIGRQTHVSSMKHFKMNLKFVTYQMVNAHKQIHLIWQLKTVWLIQIIHIHGAVINPVVLLVRMSKTLLNATLVLQIAPIPLQILLHKRWA